MDNHTAKELTDILSGYQVSNDDFELILDLMETHAASEIERLRGTCTIENDNDNTFPCEVTSCCKMGPITRENHCPNCGKKIIKLKDIG